MPFPMTINSQDEFDAAVKERLAREQAKYADYDALKAKAAQYDALNAQDYPAQLAALQTRFDTTAADLAELTRSTTEAAATNSATIADLQAKLQASELVAMKSRICAESGLPYTMATRLQGATEEEIKADAQNLARFVVPVAPGVAGAAGGAAPAKTEPTHQTGGEEAKPLQGLSDEQVRDAELRTMARSIWPQKGA